MLERVTDALHDSSPTSRVARTVDVGDNKAILFMEDGSVLFRHVCDRSARDAGTIICSPALQIGRGHEIVTDDPLTIVASILCSDCSTHGFVTDGRWRPC